MKRRIVVTPHAIRRFHQRIEGTKCLGGDGEIYLKPQVFEETKQKRITAIEKVSAMLGGSGMFPLPGGGKAVVKDYTVLTVL